MKGFNAWLALLLALGVVPTAYSDQAFTVTTFFDQVDVNPGDGVCLTVDSTCSLRAAVQEANLYPSTSGTTTIELPVSGIYYLGGTADEQDAATGDLDIKERVVINGAGSDVVAIDGAFEDRVFDVLSTADLTLNDLTVRNGLIVDSDFDPNEIIVRDNYDMFDGGGGIKVFGARLTLNRVNVTNNTASVMGGGIDIMPGSTVEINASRISNNRVVGFGGGISNVNSRLVINDSTISDNLHDAQTIIFGGGIFNSGADNSLKINRSTINNNSAYRNGGGIYHQIGDLSIINSTISGNTARQWGGGLYNANTVPFYYVDLLHVTVTDNNAIGNVSENTQVPGPLDPRGAGIYNRGQDGGSNGALLRLFNSLVAQNDIDGGDCYNDIWSNPSSPAYLDKRGTLIGDDTCLNAGESPPANSYVIDIEPLADNGGATQTHALLSTSDAIDFGLAEYCPNHDQRIYGPRGTASCDSGAYEYGVGEFSQPLVSPTLPYSGPPLSRILPPTNQVPQAFDLLTVVTPGGSVDGQLSVIDADGPSGSYTFISPSPSMGSVDWLDEDGSFRYTADMGATGIEAFGYSYCDGYDCDQGLVSIVINDAAVQSSVVATVTQGTGTASPVVVIPTNLIATLSDPNFSYPLGAMFFKVTGISATASSVEVTLELPSGLSIDPSAVVRKMNRFGSWMTLSSTPDPNLSSAVFTPASGSNPATVTLTLVDNDIFDHDLTDGSISDPVALGLSTAASTSSQTGGSNNPATSGGSSGTSSGGGGGGVVGLEWLSLLILMGLVRRRRSPVNLC